MPQNGIYSVTVPGAVAGWDALRSRFGTKPISTSFWPPQFTTPRMDFPITEVIGKGWGSERLSTNCRSNRIPRKLF